MSTQPWRSIGTGVWERSMPSTLIRVTMTAPHDTVRDEIQYRWQVFFTSGKAAFWGRTRTMGEAIKKAVARAALLHPMSTESIE